jgi:hypothetical protein
MLDDDSMGTKSILSLSCSTVRPYMERSQDGSRRPTKSFNSRHVLSEGSATAHYSSVSGVLVFPDTS